MTQNESRGVFNAVTERRGARVAQSNASGRYRRRDGRERLWQPFVVDGFALQIRQEQKLRGRMCSNEGAKDKSAQSNFLKTGDRLLDHGQTIYLPACKG
jgi:hypothetical protein